MSEPEFQQLDPDHELPPESPSEAALAALGEELRQAQQERDALKDRLLRAAADADNARKRSQRELHDARVYAAGEALRPFLAVLDGFERASAHASKDGDDIQALRKGIELLHRQLVEAGRKAGLEPIEALSQPFDPHLHEAIEMVDGGDAPTGTVVEELQRGYKLKDRLLRPAMVKVAR